MSTGKPERGRQLLEAALESGNPLLVPLAQVILGGVLVDAGEPERARQLLEAALESGNPLVVPLAQVGLGGLLVDAGEPERARQLLEAALESGNPLVVPLAQVGLGGLLVSTGKPERGRQLLEAALDPAHQVVPQAAVLLGDLLQEDEDWAYADAVYQAAIDSADPTWSPSAQVSLAVMRLRHGTGPRTARSRSCGGELSNRTNGRCFARKFARRKRGLGGCGGHLSDGRPHRRSVLDASRPDRTRAHTLAPRRNRPGPGATTLRNQIEFTGRDSGRVRRLG